MKFQDLKNNQAILCEIEGEQERILRMLHREGYVWAGGQQITNEDYSLGPVFYLTKRGLKWSDSSWAKKKGSELIPSTSFRENLKISDLKPGDRVLCQNKPEQERIIRLLDGHGYRWINGKKIVKQSGSVRNKFIAVESAYLMIHRDGLMSWGEPIWCPQEELIPSESIVEFMEGDWVYFSSGWETVMKFSHIDGDITHGTHSYTVYPDGEIELMDSDTTACKVRLATEEEVSRIVDVYAAAGHKEEKNQFIEDVIDHYPPAIEKYRKLVNNHRFDKAMKFLETSGDVVQALKIAAGL